MHPEQGKRLDQYLVRVGLAPSRRAAQRMIASGYVLLNGHIGRKGETVREGDRVEVAPGRELSSAIVPNPDLAIEVLYRDDAVLVVGKPGGLPCHPIRPAERATVMNGVVACFPETASAGTKLNEGGLVHRLDNGTSGALIVARTPEAFAELRNAVRQARLGHLYLALVAGAVTERLEIDTPVAHHPDNPRKMIVAPLGEAHSLSARAAHTIAYPLSRHGPFTLLEVTPVSAGARHQIRVHLASSGHPIVGDELYGGPPHPALISGRFWLHLARVEFRSPAMGRIVVDAPLAPDLEALLE